MAKGLVHLYYGDGKGKTTAAFGLALRALGQKKKVLVIQFLKDGTSGEIAPLRSLGAEVLAGPPGQHFVSMMDDKEKDITFEWNNHLLRQAAGSDCDLLILDELCAARQYHLAAKELAMEAVLSRPEEREVVITGRSPEEWMLEAADYSTMMQCRRHPYEKGILAREGIEY